MKGMLIAGAIIAFIGGYFILGSESISKLIEQYSVEKMKDPELEKMSLYNIRYMDLTGKYERCMELIDKYNQRYEDEGHFLKELLLTQARIFEIQMNLGKARDTYQKYVDKFPDAENVNDIRRKILELK